MFFCAVTQTIWEFHKCILWLKLRSVELCDNPCDVLVITRNGFHRMQLYFIATDRESFYDQWYKNDDGTEPCGHFDMVGNDRIDTICAKCFDGENGEDWFHCPRFGQWYHEECFYVWIYDFCFEAFPNFFFRQSINVQW